MAQKKQKSPKKVCMVDGSVFNSIWCSSFAKKSKGGVTSSSEGGRAFLLGIANLVFNEFWYFLKIEVSFLLYWFFKQLKRGTFVPFIHFFKFFFEKIRG